MPKRLSTLILTMLFACFSMQVMAQTVVVPGTVTLPQDTVIKTQLIASLNGFLQQRGGPNKDNKYALKGDLLSTSALLDEMKGVERSSRFNDTGFYKCHLANVVKLDDARYLLQLHFIGIMEGTPILRASFRLMAKYENGQFYFSSPLVQNTLNWKTAKLMNVTFHFKEMLNRTDAELYYKTVSYYDRKLKVPVSPISFYYADNFPEAQQLMGIDYKSDFNGQRANNLSARENNESLVVSGGAAYDHHFDPHDLWHERLRVVMNADIINRPVDEGCAYLYGGSWGYTWAEVLTKFKQYATANPQADWLTLYTGSAKFASDDKPLYVAYALNALIAQKMEREKGFSVVKSLLGCGKRETGDENYFAALEKVTGITRANFNTAMWDLVKAAK